MMGKYVIGFIAKKLTGGKSVSFNMISGKRISYVVDIFFRERNVNFYYFDYIVSIDNKYSINTY